MEEMYDVKITLRTTSLHDKCISYYNQNYACANNKLLWYTYTQGEVWKYNPNSLVSMNISSQNWLIPSAAPPPPLPKHISHHMQVTEKLCGEAGLPRIKRQQTVNKWYTIVILPVFLQHKSRILQQWNALTSVD